MSVERSLEAWEEVQRHGQDFADRLTQSFTGLLHSTHITGLPNAKLQYPFDHHIEFPSSNSWNHLSSAVPVTGNIIDGVSAIFDIGNRLGQVSTELGTCLNGVVQQFARHVPVPVPIPFWNESNLVGVDAVRLDGRREEAAGTSGDRELLESMVGYEDVVEENTFDPNASPYFRCPEGNVNFTSTYDSRTGDIETSLAARGDLWRVEASHGGLSSGGQRSPPFLVQLGPVLFVRDTTLLLPVHLSKQHLIWYGYDRKEGVHSLCPAIWSKHRRWFSMSMISLNPLSCSFLDMQFPNGQLTYVAGEGFSTSALLPVLGGLLQVQSQYPGETRLSFSCKNKWGTCITPTVQWPERSFALGVSQALAWERSGLLYKPTFWFSISPTFGGSNHGIRAEFIHSLKEKLSLICGYTSTVRPSAYASIAIGRSKWNGNVGNSGIVVRVESPLGSVGRLSFSIQLNSGLDF